MTKMLTVKEVAERMGIDIQEARKYIKQPNFPKVKIGTKTYIIPEDAFEEWLEHKGTEKWKPLMYGDIDLTNRYEVSNTGKLRSIIDKRILKQHKNKQGYMVICISFGKHKRKVLKMHRAVAFAFIDNPNGYPVINHIDGNKTNNKVDNLEWCTIQDNVNHAIRTGLCHPGIYTRRN